MPQHLATTTTISISTKRHPSAYCLAINLSKRRGILTDIHPAARLGSGLFLDHATGVVIGETAVVEDNVSILHAVTLGGTGKASGDRHPKIRSGVLIGAGAKILGNIEVGHCTKVAAGSVVLKSVPNNVTVAGIPAKIIGGSGCTEPSRAMDQMLGDADAHDVIFLLNILGFLWLLGLFTRYSLC